MTATMIQEQAGKETPAQETKTPLLIDDRYAELVNPVTGKIDPQWYRLRLRYRRPIGYWFSLHSRPGRMMKRIVDIVGSFMALLMLLPVFIVTAIAIRLDSKGPIFFSQKRVGAGGREFNFYKFRSMRPDAEKIKDQLLKMNQSKDGVIFKMKDDPRITRVGKFIRKYSIDELPQFYNVLRGDMSLVGARPPVPREVSEYDTEAWRRLEIIPGLTCIWQISGRSAIGFRDQVKLDVKYLTRQDVFFDIALCFLTVPAVLKGDGAF